MTLRRTLMTAAVAIAAIGFFQQARIFATAPLAPSPLPGFADALPHRMKVTAQMPDEGSRTPEETSLDRGFELYTDRGRLNMRRGLDVTIDAIDAGDTSVDPSGARECDLLKAAFALKCVVLAARDRMLRTAGHRVELGLAFQENIRSDDWSRPNRDRFRVIRRPIAAVVATGNDHAAARMAIYRQLGGLCGTVSPDRRNCSLLAGEISLEVRPGRLKATGEAILGLVEDGGEIK